MAKHIAIFFITALIAAAALAGVSACASTEIEKCASRMADYRPVLMTGSADGMHVRLIGGVREDPYSLDGSCSDVKTDYTVITVTGADGGEEMPACAVIGGTEHSFTLVRHPFRDGYSAELPVRPAEGDSVELTVSGVRAELSSVSASVDGEYALTLARELVDDDGEIVLRLTENSVAENGDAYWYVSFTSADGFSAVLINAQTGEAGAVRTR